MHSNFNYILLDLKFLQSLKLTKSSQAIGCVNWLKMTSVSVTVSVIIIRS
jgi:hypothetical protein